MSKETNQTNKSGSQQEENKHYEVQHRTKINAIKKTRNYNKKKHSNNGKLILKVNYVGFRGIY